VSLYSLFSLLAWNATPTVLKGALTSISSSDESYTRSTLNVLSAVCTSESSSGEVIFTVVFVLYSPSSISAPSSDSATYVVALNLNVGLIDDALYPSWKVPKLPRVTD
jgi:hypothetical protein